MFGHKLRIVPKAVGYVIGLLYARLVGLRQRRLPRVGRQFLGIFLPVKPRLADQLPSPLAVLPNQCQIAFCRNLTGAAQGFDLPVECIGLFSGGGNLVR